jgi:hypothetical protein
MPRRRQIPAFLLLSWPLAWSQLIEIAREPGRQDQASIRGVAQGISGRLPVYTRPGKKQRAIRHKPRNRERASRFLGLCLIAVRCSEKANNRTSLPDLGAMCVSGRLLCSPVSG